MESVGILNEARAHNVQIAHRRASYLREQKIVNIFFSLVFSVIALFQLTKFLAQILRKDLYVRTHK